MYPAGYRPDMTLVEPQRTADSPRPTQAPTRREIYLVRHGETVWSLTGQHTGRTDLPLTAGGEGQARRLKERLETMTFGHVFSTSAYSVTTTRSRAESFDYGMTPTVTSGERASAGGLSATARRA